MPSGDKVIERTLEPTQEVIDKAFEVFYRQEVLEDLLTPSQRRFPPAQLSTSQEEINIPEDMVLEEKASDLLELLTTYTRGTSAVVHVVPRPPTLAPTHVSSGDAIDKKGKEYKGAKDPRMLKRERLQALPSSPQPRRPKLLRLNKRKVLLLGPPRS